MAKRFGVMLDVSRNSVMRVESIKKFVSYIKKMGYNTLLLYTEDTFEVNNEPYFGYLRGKYTKEEIKEIDRYCKENNIELIPCIQTLAHLNGIFKWGEYNKIHDIDDILLVDDERTYELLDNIFSTIKECFSSNLVHIGMDEAHHLGLGQFLQKNGYKNNFEIFSKHLKVVESIAKKYSLKCMMWSDMFFRMATNGDYYDENNKFVVTDEIKNSVNKDVELVYWDYYHNDIKKYDNMIEKHKLLSDNNLWFAGGAWSWVGFTPHNKHTINTMIPAMKSCKKNNVENIFITMWGDNGGECSKFSLLPSLYYIKSIYDGITDENVIKDNFYKLTEENFDDLMMLDLPDCLSKKESYLSNPSKYVLFDDVFCGFLSCGFPRDGKEICLNNCNILNKVNSKNFGYLFNTAFSLSKALYYKIDLSSRIRNAYELNDFKELKKCVKQIDVTIRNINIFYKNFKKQWFLENKANGFEVQENRLGGLLLRLTSCKEMLKQFIYHKIDKIEELEEKLLHIYDDEYGKNSLEFFNGWSENVSVNRM